MCMWPRNLVLSHLFPGFIFKHCHSPARANASRATSTMISGPTALDHEQPAPSSGLGRALMTSTFCGMACKLYLGFDFRKEFICP